MQKTLIFALAVFVILACVPFIAGNSDNSKPNNPRETITKAIEPVKNTRNRYLSNYAFIPALQTIINADGSISVLDTENAIVYEYSARAEFIRAQRFRKELDMVGAFTKDRSGNYYIFYAKEVKEGAYDEKNMALARYSSSGQKQREFLMEAHPGGSPYGWGVMLPFRLGTCQLEISGNMIAVYFGRELFKTPDGLNHQASFGFILDINTFNLLTGEDEDTLKIPFVSHSFNQFILPVDDGFMFVDHGDGNPRAFAFEKLSKREGRENKKIRSFTFKSGKLFPTDFFGIKGVIGDNNTYAEMGSLAKTPNGYLFVGTSERNTVVREQHNDSRNLFLLTMNEDLTPVGKLPVITNPIWLTNYTDKNTETAVSPKIVQIDLARYLLMWEVYNTVNRRVKTYMTIVDDKGAITSQIKEIEGAQLNGYDALRYNPKTGLAHWATSVDGNEIRLYSFNPSDEPNFVQPKPAETSPEPLVSAAMSAVEKISISNDPPSFPVDFDNSNNIQLVALVPPEGFNKPNNDQDYFETFTIPDRKGFVSAGDIRLQLLRTDVGNRQYDIRVFVDGNTIEKKSNKINEPLQFFVGSGRVLHEVYINWIRRDSAGGYVRIRK